MELSESMNIREKRRAYLRSMIEKYGFKKGAEIGCLVGWTHFYLLENCPSLTMYAVDSWKDKSGSCNYSSQQANKAEFYRNARKFAPRCIIKEMDSVEAASTIEDESLDFVFIDGDHTYEGCKRDIEAWLPKIKNDGWIFGHDYLEFPGVKKAVDEKFGVVGCAYDFTDEVWSVQKNQAQSITICCIKAGDKYGPEYVNKLYNMVQRNVLTVGFNFLCFTDDTDGIDPHIPCRPLPLEGRVEGWWHKMMMFREKIPGVASDKVLFLDLDNVVCNLLDPILEFDSTFAMARDYPKGTYPLSDKRSYWGESSVVLLKVGSKTEIWKEFSKNIKKSVKEAPGDQEWINDKFYASMDLLPGTLAQSYKLNNLEGNIKPESSVIMFHGEPKPADCGGWVKEEWR